VSEKSDTKEEDRQEHKLINRKTERRGTMTETEIGDRMIQ
jgi:hypothetical protein